MPAKSKSTKKPESVKAETIKSKNEITGTSFAVKIAVASVLFLVLKNFAHR